jgi:hypothetical protein
VVVNAYLVNIANGPTAKTGRKIDHLTCPWPKRVRMSTVSQCARRPGEDVWGYTLCAIFIQTVSWKLGEIEQGSAYSEFFILWDVLFYPQDVADRSLRVCRRLAYIEGVILFLGMSAAELLSELVWGGFLELQGAARGGMTIGWHLASFYMCARVFNYGVLTNCGVGVRVPTLNVEGRTCTVKAMEATKSSYP